jgi:phosphoenolpyruvate phosphomutase
MLMSAKPQTSRAARLRALLQSPQLEFIMEAHNGISARIVEEAGFSGIWGSGLSLSAQYGVRDNNEASWTQVVDMLDFMTDASSLPILLDGDTGYGNFNNLRRLVRKLEQRGIAGVCIEDKLFPKKNSFIAGERQELAKIDEFCGKIKAGKDTQLDPDFSIVARVEALIAGWSMSEALKRAEAYRRAGADAILIHSKRSKPDEILEFAREWAGRCPLVIVPTKYFSTPTEVFRRAGISLVIWANHMLRAAVPAMQAAAREVFQTQTLVGIEERIAGVNEIFRLQGADEYDEAEKRYAGNGHAARAIVLAASRGDNLDEVTQDRPKVMLQISGQPLLRRLVDAFRKQNVADITVVAGYRPDAIDVPGPAVVVNAEYETTGELASLACALDRFGEDTVITYGDLLFRRYILRDLLEADADLTVVVDSSPAATAPCDVAYTDSPDERGVFGHDVSLQRVVHVQAGAALPAGSAGRWIGMLRVRGPGREQLLSALHALRARPDFNTLGMPDLLNALVAAGQRVKVLYVTGHWLDVNDHESLRRAGDFAYGASPFGARS